MNHLAKDREFTEGRANRADERTAAKPLREKHVQIALPQKRNTSDSPSINTANGMPAGKSATSDMPV